MKKSLLALAALTAIAGAASAQSSVTISGVIDVGVEHTSTGGTTAGTATQVGRSNMGTSNITFKGVEDLGSGMKASFTVSHEFQGDNGDSGTPGGGTGWGNFGSWVGLSGGFGSVDIGNVFTTTFKAHQTPNGTKGGSNSTAYAVLAFDACETAAANVNIAAAATAAAGSCAHVFSRNTLQYNSPSIAGLTASLDVVMPEAKTTATTPPNQNISHGHTFGLKYVAGPLDVRTAVERGIGQSSDLVLLSASFDAGVAKLFANFENGQRRAATSGKKNAFLLGARAPIGASGSVWAHYGVQAQGGSVDTAGGATERSDKKVLGLGYQHKLSGRTSLYANYGKQTDAGKSDNDKTDVGVGVMHSF
jgi:predicted porin